MADLSVSDLEAFAKSIAANDIYSQMAQPLIGFRPDVFTAVAGDPSVGVMPKVNVMSPWESLATTFATSLGGGLLQNYGKQQQANQISALTSLLPQLISDPTSVGVPEDMDSAAFNSIKSKAIAAKAETSKKEDRENKTLLVQLLAKAETPEERERLLGVASSLDMMPEGVDLAVKAEEKPTGLAAVPKGLQKDAVQELAHLQGRDQSLDFIDDAFESAKKLVGPEAAVDIWGYKTDKAQLLSGMQQSLTYQIDNVVGREVNSDVRQQFKDLTPKWYDDEKLLDAKKQKLKELVTKLTKPTPILSSLGLTAPVGGYKGGLPAPSKAFILDAKKRGLSREQARLEWEAANG